MKYVQVTRQHTVYTKTKCHTFIKDELLTAAEYNKLNQQFGLSREDYEIVDIPKNKTGWFFGIRISLL